MKRTLKLFYEINEQQYYVLYQQLGKDLLFKVNQVNPTMISRVIERAIFINHYERGKIIEEMEQFVKNGNREDGE
ncbi:hypothetical protein FE904_21995 [Chryseobacterium indologenes]|uniref:hypothetical protein n=1 Tax=Chryseobacterium indologenes TaxID=253 RepID=UPI001109955A|nr:hypothetical protein [Chryseobacterium indologenes]TLX23433.1 hypothetical protein FE904_21995 [Chryseobacterium indologenes]